jgi:hypothetical protein
MQPACRHLIDGAYPSLEHGPNFDPLPEPRNAETLGADYPTNTSPVMNGWIMQTNVYGLPDASAKRNT